MVDPLIIQVYRCQPPNLPQPRAVSSLFPPFYSRGVCWSCKLWSEEDVCLLFGIQYISKIPNPNSKEPVWRCKLWSEEDVCLLFGIQYKSKIQNPRKLFGIVNYDQRKTFGLLFGIQYKSKIQNPKSKEPVWRCKLWSEEDVESALLHCRCSFTRPTFSITTDSHFATPEPEQGQFWQ